LILLYHLFIYKKTAETSGLYADINPYYIGSCAEQYYIEYPIAERHFSSFLYLLQEKNIIVNPCTCFENMIKFICINDFKIVKITKLPESYG